MSSQLCTIHRKALVRWWLRTLFSVCVLPAISSLHSRDKEFLYSRQVKGHSGPRNAARAASMRWTRLESNVVKSINERSIEGSILVLMMVVGLVSLLLAEHSSDFLSAKYVTHYSWFYEDFNEGMRNTEETNESLLTIFPEKRWSWCWRLASALCWTLASVIGVPLKDRNICHLCNSRWRWEPRHIVDDGWKVRLSAHSPAALYTFFVARVIILSYSTNPHLCYSFY